MTLNQMTIAAVTACTLFVAVLAFRNSRTEAENLALFQLKGELKAARWLPALILGMGLFASMMALIVDHGGRDRTWGLAVIGLIGMIFGYFMTLFSVRLEPDAVRFGFLSRRRIGYSEITEFARIHVGKGSECYLVLSSGRRVKLGEDLASEKMLADEIQRRAGCKIIWHEKGMPYPKGF
jgi:hypothetical protein